MHDGLLVGRVGDEVRPPRRAAPPNRPCGVRVTAPSVVPSAASAIPPGVAALLIALVVALTPADARAGRKDDDHDRARAAVQAGEAMPLPALLQRLQRTHPGRVLELELERDDGRWIYEVKLLQPDGRLLKLEVDAATAQVLKVRRRDRDRSGRDSDRDRARDGERGRDRPGDRDRSAGDRVEPGGDARPEGRR